MGFHLKNEILLSDINQKQPWQQILGEISNIKFRENPFGCSEFVTYGRRMVRNDKATRCIFEIFDVSNEKLF